jgi:hypothetical protein
MRPTLAQKLDRFNSEYRRLRKSKKAAEEAHRKAVECLRRIMKREVAQERRAAR